MLALRFRFLAGHYHGTPWGRHVNEGDLDWPPSPWRIVRALVATWHSKVKPLGRHDDAPLSSLVEKLASSPPHYALPRASHAHARHYMPLAKAGKTALVFDAFAVVDRSTPLDVVWTDVEIDGREASLLDDLLESMGYLGRAESWVEASRVASPAAANCVPVTDAVPATSPTEAFESVTLLSPLPVQNYRRRREGFQDSKKSFKKIAETLPENLLEAVSVETTDLLKRGWSQPPASRIVRYRRPAGALMPRRKRHRQPHPAVTTFRFLLVGKPLPRVEQSLRVGEALRGAVISRAAAATEDGIIPPWLSGHDLPADNRHGHAFYLPFDSNGDGRVDRVVVHVPAGVEGHAAAIVEGLWLLRTPGGGEWRLVLEAVGGHTVAPELTDAATVWESRTPYLHPWHLKKNFRVEDQVRRECRLRGLPEPTVIERLPSLRVGPRSRRCIDFVRHRRRKGIAQPDRRGSFVRLAFRTPLRGPLALGFACHYGLGLFRPVSSSP